jgi:hypothetical protein
MRCPSYAWPGAKSLIGYHGAVWSVRLRTGIACRGRRRRGEGAPRRCTAQRGRLEAACGGPGGGGGRSAPPLSWALGPGRGGGVSSQAEVTVERAREQCPITLGVVSRNVLGAQIGAPVAGRHAQDPRAPGRQAIYYPEPTPPPKKEEPKPYHPEPTPAQVRECAPPLPAELLDLIPLAAPRQVCHPALEAAVGQQPPVLVRQGQGLHPVHEGAGVVCACSCTGRFKGCGADKGALGEKAVGSLVHAKRCRRGSVLGVTYALVRLSKETEGSPRAVKT